MPEVVLSFTGLVRRPPGLGVRSRVELPEAASTVEGLLASLGYDDRERALIKALVDGQPVPRDRPLAGGETVTLFLPVGGG